MNYLLEKQSELVQNLWKQRLRLCKFIASRYARRTGRDHLRPKAPPGGPLALWRKLPLALEVKIDRYLTASRGPDASAETCEKVPAGRFSASGSDRNAHIHLAHSCSQNMNCTFARINRFKPTCRPNDESENRPGGSHIVLVQPEQIFDRIARAARNP